MLWRRPLLTLLLTRAVDCQGRPKTILPTLTLNLAGRTRQGFEDWPGPDYDTLDPLADRATDVQVYGSQEAAQRDGALLRAMSAWADSTDDVRDKRSDEMEQARASFVAEVRTDLGVTD